MLHKLESLRGVAACLVVLFHSPFYFSESSVAFFDNSYLFVDLFFILSGFVMALAYGEPIRNGLSFTTYIIARLGRIYPLHLFMLILWVPYILVKQYLFESGFGGTDQVDDSNLGTFVSNFFLIHSMGIHDTLGWNYPSWSISTEFFAYIFFFMTSALLDKRNSLLFPILISVLSYGVIISLQRDSFDITYDYGFFRCIGAFYLGVFLFRSMRFLSLKETINNNIYVLEMASVALVIASVSVAALHPLGFLFVILSFAICIYVFSLEASGIVGSLLMKTPFRKIGLWSYSIYLVHAIILAGVSNVFQHIFKYNLDSALGFTAVLINLSVLLVTIGISKYTYTYIEKRFRDKSRAMSKKYSKPMQPVTSTPTE